MSKPRLLLVPMLTELEWLIRPALEQWAEVAAYDAPGLGRERERISESVAERGLEELDHRGWERFVVVADEFGCGAAARLVAARPDAVEAIALGHARTSNSTEGERAAINREILAALEELARHDYRTFVRQLFKLTQGEQVRGGYTDELVDRYMERVPADMAADFYETRPEAGRAIGELLRGVDAPMLLVQHKGCLLFTDEGFEDAVAAFPRAQVERLDDKPSASPDFARLLRSFCDELAIA